MVFGFGKKKAVESPANTVHQREVSFEEIPHLLKELERPRISGMLQEGTRLKNEIESCQKSIHRLILDLESDDLKLHDVDKNLRSLGNRGKDAVVATIKKETTVRLTNIDRYEDVVALNLETGQMLKRMGDILGVHTRVMHVFARKYADKLKEEIAKLAQERNSLQKLVNEQEIFKSSSNFILETVKKMNNLRAEEGQKKQRLSEDINEKAEAANTITRLEQEISVLKSKPEHNKFLEVKKKIDMHSHEKGEVREKVAAQFTKISRPLNKYSYVSSFDKPMKKLMEELIADPYEVISEQNREPIKEILQATAKSVVAGNVSVKDSDKSIESIEETIERLDEFLKLKSSYAKKLADLESHLDVFDAKALEEKEKSLDKTRSRLSDLERSREKLEKEILENTKSTDVLKAELEKSLSRLSNGKVIVKT